MLTELNALFDQARERQRQGNDAAAESLYRQVLQLAEHQPGLEPARAEAHHRLARLAERQHQLETAIGHYRALCQLRPQSPEPWCRLGLLLLQTSHTRAAASALEQALNLDPEDAPLRASLALIQHELGELSSARAHYEQALNQLPERPDLHYRLAQLLEPEAALGQLELALRLKPDWDAPRLLQARLLGDSEAAASAYRELLSRHPAHAEGHYHYACLLRRQNLPELADRHLDQALQQEYFLPRAWFEKALLARARGDLAAAAACLGEAYKMDPNQPELNRELAAVCAAQGQHAQAARHQQIADWLARDLAETEP